MTSDAHSSKIIEKIEEKTQRTIQQIKDEMERTLAKINQETEEKIKAIKEKILSEAKKQAEVEFLREKTKHELDFKLKLTKYRDQLVDHFIDLAKEELAKITKTPRYSTSLQNMLINGAITLKENDIRVFYRKEDKSILTQDFLSKISDILEKDYGIKVQFHLSDTFIEGIGGIILETMDGSIRINNTYERRIERYYNDLKIELSKLLI